jgi:hypothetical protein
MNSLHEGLVGDDVHVKRNRVNEFSRVLLYRLYRFIIKVHSQKRERNTRDFGCQCTGRGGGISLGW